MMRLDSVRPSFWMMLLGVAGAEVCQIMAPRITPPGNVWGIADTGSLILLALAASWAGWNGLGYLVGVLGAIGGLLFDVWLPDSRDMLSIGDGIERLENYLARYLLFAVATGSGSMMIALTARRLREFHDDRINSQSPSCRKWGYDIRGLPEPRCPECGERFFNDAGNVSLDWNNNQENQQDGLN